MNRRAFLGTAASGSVLIAGCSQVEQLASDASDAASGKKSLSDTVTYDEIEVTVTDSMTSDQFTLNGDEVTSPGNGTYAVFRIEAYNTDVTERDGPTVNPENYDTLEEEEGTFYMAGINDIRVFGDGEGGHFPDARWEPEYEQTQRDDGTIVMGEKITLSVGEQELEPYPTGTTQPRIDPDSTISGWTVGVIDTDATPELKINFNGKSETWSGGSDG